MALKAYIQSPVSFKVDLTGWVVCKCLECKGIIGEIDDNSTARLYCRKCKIYNIFTLINEPDCRRVTAFIEKEKINEKTVSNHSVRNVA